MSPEKIVGWLLLLLGVGLIGIVAQSAWELKENPGALFSFEEQRKEVLTKGPSKLSPEVLKDPAKFNQIIFETISQSIDLSGPLESLLTLSVYFASYSVLLMAGTRLANLGIQLLKDEKTLSSR